MNDLLSVPEAAERLGLKPAMVRRYCQSGDLPAVKVTGAWLIDEADLEEFAKKPRKRGPKVKGKVQ